MNVLAWAWGFVWLVVACLIWLPWVERLRPDSDSGEWRVMRWPLAVGLGLGALTLWLIAIGFWRLNTWVALALPAVLLFAWLLSLWSKPGTRRRGYNKASVFSVMNYSLSALRRGEATAWVIAAGLVTLVVVAAQSTYYPFIGEDEISRYAYYARLMFVRGQVTSAVRGYPMYLPAAYAFVFLVTGQLAEQLARLIPAALSAMTVLATGALAWRWYGSRGGWAAAFALIVTPLYVHWSPDGYVDIASALYFVLCAYAADVWLATRKMKWAALAGALAGLTLWTKQAGFAALACLGAMVAWSLIREWINGERDRIVPAILAGLLVVVAAFLCGGWWYVRNAIYEGWGGAVPGPGQFYYQLANRDWTYLIPFVGNFRSFGVAASLLYLAGLLWGAARPQRAAWPLVWSAPYTLLWWWFFSYDSRFILTVLPFYATMFGGLLSEVRWQATGPWRWGVVAAIGLAVSTSIVSARLGGLRQWLVAPTATYAERLYRAKGDMYRVVEFLRDEIPASSRVVSMDGRLRYYLIDRDMDVLYPTRLSDLAAYDYFVVGYWWASAYAGFGAADSEVAQELSLSHPTRLEVVYTGPEDSLTIYHLVQP